MRLFQKYLVVLSALASLLLNVSGVVNLDITLGIIAAVLILRAIFRRKSGSRRSSDRRLISIVESCEFLALTLVNFIHTFLNVYCIFYVLATMKTAVTSHTFAPIKLNR